jgi:hypothetical protein
LGYLEGGLRLEILARYTIYIYNSIPSQNLKSLAPLKVLQTDPPRILTEIFFGSKFFFEVLARSRRADHFGLRT